MLSVHGELHHRITRPMNVRGRCTRLSEISKDQMPAGLRSVLGQKKYEFFFDNVGEGVKSLG
jgi:hypothetical protein